MTGSVRWLIALSAAPLALFALSLLRAGLVQGGDLAAQACGGCLMVAALHHDLALWSTFLFATALWALLPRAIAWVAVLLQLGILVVVAADLVTATEFNMRLSWRDVIKFSGESGEVGSYLLSWLQSGTGLLIALVILAFAILWSVHLAAARRARRATFRGTGIAAALCAVIYALPSQAHHPLPWIYRNVVEVNLPSGVDVPYSDAYRKQLLREYSPPPVQCSPGRNLRANVLLVIFESWSWYHSGIQFDDMDATPSLDRLAGRGTTWTRFFSNGFTTDHGLIALLGGRAPLPAVHRYHSMDAYAGFEGPNGSLPERLNESGYHTHFFTTGDLAFLDKGEWLESLGFDLVEGHEHPFYDGAERYGFNAAHDGWLYERFLDWHADRSDATQPFLGVLETVSTHQPFVVPGTGERNERKAFRYADARFGEFVQELERREFFDDGLLLVTSDQRALTPLRESEVEAFGNAAPALLPFIAIGSVFGEGERIDTRAQMSDLPGSLDYLLTDRSCRGQYVGNMFAVPPKPPRCILRPQGNDRDIIDVYCGTGHARVKLDGDDTRVISGSVPDKAELLRRINALRIRLGERNVDFTNIL